MSLYIDVHCHLDFEGLIERIDEVIAREVRRASRYDRPLSALMLDLDHFKRVNDEDESHAQGDSVLREFVKNV